MQLMNFATKAQTIWIAQSFGNAEYYDFDRLS